MAISSNYNSISARGLGIQPTTATAAATDTNTTNGKSSLDNTQYTTKTDKETRIVKKGQETDKNMFLKILAAEMKYQDPMGQSKDSSAFVGQLAQFTSIEQMQNLNKTTATAAANSLIGKGVDLNITDEQGSPMVGIIRVTQDRAGEMIFGVEVIKNGKSEVIEASKDNIVSTYDLPDYNMENLNVTTALMYASSMIGKNVEITKETPAKPDAASKDPVKETIKGKVVGVFRDKEGVKITLDLGNGEKKDFLYGEVTKIEGSN